MRNLTNNCSYVPEHIGTRNITVHSRTLTAASRRYNRPEQTRTKRFEAACERNDTKPTERPGASAAGGSRREDYIHSKAVGILRRPVLAP